MDEGISAKEEQERMNFVVGLMVGIAVCSIYHIIEDIVEDTWL